MVHRVDVLPCPFERKEEAVDRCYGQVDQSLLRHLKSSLVTETFPGLCSSIFACARSMIQKLPALNSPPRHDE